MLPGPAAHLVASNSGITVKERTAVDDTVGIGKPDRWVSDLKKIKLLFHLVQTCMHSKIVTISREELGIVRSQIDLSWTITFHHVTRVDSSTITRANGHGLE